MADNDDMKDRYAQALAAKNAKSSKGTQHGSAPKADKGQANADRAGGKREFRRKSGG